MRRLIGPSLGLGCVLALMLACFGQVLFGGEQFAYRDAAHFYYPLYQRVQQEWAKHRLPLWDATENAGMPLLGNPTAAVLYPAKVIYAVLPYPWAARAYTIAHVALALVGMYLLMRGWQTSRTGSAFAAIVYAFGAPVLFQYCNIIYLVGAAWVPFGLSAVDRWLRAGSRWALLGLALVLALQTLGGAPEEAYVLGLCAGGYAIGLEIARRRARDGAAPARASRVAMGAVALVVAWFAGVLLCAWIFPNFRPVRRNPPHVPLPWWPWVSGASAVGWAVVAVWMQRRTRTLTTMLGGLGLAAILAGLISAAQLIPVMEYTRRTVRAADNGPHDVYPFSLEPYRSAEFLWPNVFGSTQTGNHSWGPFIPPRHKIEVWVPSLYLGGASIVLALSAFGLRGTGARRVWLSWIALLGLLGSLGEFGSPLWVARCIPAVAAVVGPHDPVDTLPVRADGKLRDGDGGVYGVMTLIFPGFGGFRYPSKLLTFVCAGLAGLAGIGLDRLAAGQTRRAVRIASALACASLILLAAVQIGRSAFVDVLTAQSTGPTFSIYGPFRPLGAWRECRRALLHGSVVFTIGAVLFATARRRPKGASLATLVLLTADLVVSNAPLILTVPQSVFESTPELLTRIAEAEADDPSPGPFRIHRMPSWEPFGWGNLASDDRNRQMVEWERKTLQPKYAIPYGLCYTLTHGVGELYDYEWFFSPSLGNRQMADAEAGGEKPKAPIFYPRRGFDLWNTRYFLLPSRNVNVEMRAISSFLRETEAIAPSPEKFKGPRGAALLQEWSDEEDWQLLKNPRAFPRAWIVHSAEFRPPVKGLAREGRESLMLEILYDNDPFWAENIPVRDLRRTAFIEDRDGTHLLPFLSQKGPDPEESATVVGLDDQRVEIEAVLKSPGIVILGDVNYPGWELTIDGRPATILPANRLMRGAAVPSGTHTLVYRYRPLSVRVGIVASLFGLCVLSLSAIAFRTRPRSPLLSSSW